MNANEVTTVYYYGTGVSQADKVAIISNSLRAVLPNATLHIEHDLLAAARAACGRAPGIACILGTGSNSCLYDSEQISDNVPSLGFLLGDEGSGANLSRKLLKAYYYRELPPDLCRELETWQNMDKAEVLNSIYHAAKPNEATARFAPFVIDRLHHPWMRAFVKEELHDFLNKSVLKYEGHGTLPIHFVGSIAFLCRDLITEILTEMGLQTGCFLKEPMHQLIDYHTQP